MKPRFMLTCGFQKCRDGFQIGQHVGGSQSRVVDCSDKAFGSVTDGGNGPVQDSQAGGRLEPFVRAEVQLVQVFQAVFFIGVHHADGDSNLMRVDGAEVQQGGKRRMGFGDAGEGIAERRVGGEAVNRGLKNRIKAGGHSL